MVNGMLLTDDEDDDDLLKMFHGGMDGPLLVGRLPSAVRNALGWVETGIYLTKTTAQKIRFHPAHPVGILNALKIRQIIKHGHIVCDDRENSVVFMLETGVVKNGKPRWYFLAAALDRGHRGIFVRTMYIRDVTKRKLRRMTILCERGTPLNRWQVGRIIEQAA